MRPNHAAMQQRLRETEFMSDVVSLRGTVKTANYCSVLTGYRMEHWDLAFEPCRPSALRSPLRDMLGLRWQIIELSVFGERSGLLAGGEKY